MNEILYQTNLYAQQKNVSLNVTKNELCVVFGAFLLSGYSKYPNKRPFDFYWSKEDDSPFILSKASRCRRFESIIHHLHFNDDLRINPDDRLYKLRPLLDYLAKKFLDLGVVKEHLLVEKFMIPYFGRHYATQFIKGKPMRFGYKNRALCSSTGYMLAFDL